MKKALKNTTKLLIFLYGVDLNAKGVAHYTHVHRLFPYLSASGRRSLVSYLKNKKYILVEDFDDTKQLFITSHGIEYIHNQFPALSSRYDDWDRTWSMLVFIEGPQSDPHFRYLRQLLLETYAGQLSRGVYLYPKQFHTRVSEQFQYYRGCISITTIKSWDFGDERSIIVPLFQLHDIKDSLSGVSKEVDFLLANFNDQKRTMLRREDELGLAFDRLCAMLAFDVGIHKAYFPQVERLKEILPRLCSLYLL